MNVRFHPALEPLMVPASGLYPSPENPNNGDIDEIIASILRNGVYRPIYATEAGMIVAGHHLYAALMELGCLMVPVLYTVEEDGARRVMLADNRIAALARTDDALLLQLLDLIAETEHGLSGTGYDERYLAALRDKAIRDGNEPLHIDLTGTEDLTHTITCPSCGYSWVRGEHGRNEP